MKEKILEAYKKEILIDKGEIKEFINSWLNGEWLDDWIRYRSRTLYGWWEVLILGPWRLTIWWPFLLVAYLWNRIVGYTFIPLLVVSKRYQRVYKILLIIEKFLKTFFGFFWIKQVWPEWKERKAKSIVFNIRKFYSFATDFEKRGYEKVDEFYAGVKRRLYNLFENNVIYMWKLLKGALAALEKRYERKYVAIKTLIAIRRERLPLYIKLRKAVWRYRINVLKTWIKIPKEVVYCKLLICLRNICIGFQAIFILIQGILLTIEIILIPERVSLKIRVGIKYVIYRIKTFFGK